MKKEWIIWAVIGLLAAALVVGVIALTNALNYTPAPSPDTNPSTDSVAQETEETTKEPQVDTTVSEEQTTGTEETTTVPKEATEGQETTDPTEDTTIPPEKETEGNGFGERDPSKPTTPNQENTDPQKPTKPTEEETTAPTQPDETTPTTKEEMTYKEYLKLSTEEQIAFRNSFSSGNAFKKWYTTAKKAYEDSQQKLVIGPDGGLDIGDFITKP